MDDAKILAVSATALICNAIRGVTPIRITNVVMVPAQGIGIEKPLGQRGSLVDDFLLTLVLVLASRGENKNASEIPIDCAR